MYLLAFAVMVILHRFYAKFYVYLYNSTGVYTKNVKGFFCAKTAPWQNPTKGNFQPHLPKKFGLKK